MFDSDLNMPLQRVSKELRAFVPSRLTRLRTFAPYAPSCLPALGTLIFTRLNYAPCVPYMLLRTLLTRDIKSLIKGNFKYIYDVYICIYISYIHIHIKVNYAINRIYEKTFRSDLSAQKSLSFDKLLTTSYLLLLFVRTW